MQLVKGCFLSVNRECVEWSGGRICNESALKLTVPLGTLADIFSSVKTGGYFNWMLLVLLSRLRRLEIRCFVSLGTALAFMEKPAVLSIKQLTLAGLKCGSV